MGVKFTCSQEDMLKVAHLSLRRLVITPGIVNAGTKPLNRQLVKFVYICAIWKLKTVPGSSLNQINFIRSSLTAL